MIWDYLLQLGKRGTLMGNPLSEITPEILALSELCTQNGSIDPELYAKYEVKRGLRDLNGKGVLTGPVSYTHLMAAIRE